METWEGTPRDAGWCEARQAPGPGDETLRGLGRVGHARGEVGTPDTHMQTAPLGRVPQRRGLCSLSCTRHLLFFQSVPHLTCLALPCPPLS